MTIKEMEETLGTRTTQDLKDLQRGIGVLPAKYVQEARLDVVRILVENILKERSRRSA